MFPPPYGRRDVSRVVERTHQEERLKTQSQGRRVLSDEGGMDISENGEPYQFSRYKTVDGSGTTTKVVNAKVGIAIRWYTKLKKQVVIH